MSAILEHLLRYRALKAGFASLDAFWIEARERMAPFDTSVDRAVAAGAAADRLGYAFLGGYHAALRRLFPSVAVGERACIAATERGGAHPGSIETSLVQDAGGFWTLRGHKTWATLATPDATLFVVASLGKGPQGKSRLKVARVPASRQGVRVEPKPPPPFAPEIGHAEVVFDDVPVSGAEILDGDGYERYLKPFRTIEDIHVLAATLGYVTSVARTYAWPEASIEALVANLAALRSLGAEDASSAAVHVALAGIFTRGRALLAETGPHWASVDAAVCARWERDRAILDVAEGARIARLTAAWRALSSP